MIDDQALIYVFSCLLRQFIWQLACIVSCFHHSFLYQMFYYYANKSQMFAQNSARAFATSANSTRLSSLLAELDQALDSNLSNVLAFVQ